MKKDPAVDAYIRRESPAIQKILRQVRALVRKAAPDAEERIAWGMPMYRLEGNLVGFAAFQRHLSIFPGADAIVALRKQLGRYPTSRGTVQFPYGGGIPAALVTRLVKYCVKSNLAGAEAKRRAKPKRKKARKPPSRSSRRSRRS